MTDTMPHYDYGYDNGYRAGLQRARDLIAEGKGDEIVLRRAAQITGSPQDGAGQAEPVGYIIRDRTTGVPDWDDVVHSSVQDAVDSLTGRWSENHGEAVIEGRTPWWSTYAICPVGPPITPPHLDGSSGTE